MKKVSVVALVLVLALAFTGCTGVEQRLYKGFAKNQEITSLESDTDVTFILEATDFSEEEQMMLQQAINMLDNSKISMHQISKTNKEKTVTKAYVDMDMTFGDMKMPMEAWVDMDMSKDNPEMLEIIKMPAMIMGMMSPENPNKEYLIYDFEEMMKELPEGQEEVNNSKLMEFSKDMQTKYVDFFNNYFKEFDLGVKMAKYKGTRSANGKSLYIYEVNLDDANFKKLIRNAVNNSLENEETIKFIEEYMSDVVNIMEIPEEEQMSKEEMKEEVKEGLDKFKEELPNIKKQFNEFMDKLEDVKVLGDKGIVIEYGMNSDGYIVHTKGNIDLAIDLEAIGKAFETATKTEETTGVETKVQSKGKLKLGIEFNTNMYNINKDVKIEMPKTTEENSLRMSDLMKQQMESIEVPEAATEAATK
ncbi:hypothetical protein [Anaerosalibacter sp. Marseille-P3206]|uniref:hypothetical protein n=1 Tax=Anaerosalibacter sp. Marseille-P3206 TaxID=1871005 RepID=UPI0009876FDD|nr:hypothetical protein [Anaerosalibacter sp. Marseille-P3206]